MPRRECNVCQKIFNVPKGENAEISLLLGYKGKTVDEYGAEVCCPQCFENIQSGMYTGLENIPRKGCKINAKS